MVAKGEDLAVTADRLCTCVEQLNPGTIASILRVDGTGALRPLSAPSLPHNYSASFDGVLIGENVGSCGSAAFLGVPVTVEDIATDPKWADFKNRELPRGLKACWSTPVFNDSGRVIATFAFYFQECRGPTAREREVVEVCIHLCAIALDRHERGLDRERKAYIDMLTELPNRASFTNALSVLSCNVPGAWALLMLDVDNLKIVNDTFGHQAGDDLLKIVAIRLAESVAPHSTYRLGGDEFAVLIEGDDVANIATIAAQVRRGLTSLANCDGHSVIPTATIGAALVGPGDANVDVVRRKADFALYHAKETDRGGFVDYTPQLGSTMTNRADAIRDVTLALEDFRIDAYYQPIVCLESHAIVGVEALCRLKRPDGDVLSAASFQEALSDARIASQLSQRMMAIAASDVRKWLDMGIPFQHVGINISSSDFHGGRLEQDLCSAFDSENVPLGHVILEVTESVYVRRQDMVAARAIQSLREKGVRVALDDFGTGFASLADLLIVPIDVLKIDKSFVDRLALSEASAIIIEGLIGIASKLDIRVVAEGVETEAQALRLKEFGCTLAQGYLFSKAVHRTEATAILLRSAQTPSNILRSVMDDALSVRGELNARRSRTTMAKWQRTRKLGS